MPEEERAGRAFARNVWSILGGHRGRGYKNTMCRISTAPFLAGLAALLILAACGGGGGNNNPPGNFVPTANAGVAQTVSAGATVVLNGTASSDSDGSIASYAWTQTAGTAVTLNNPASAQPVFLAPQVSAVAALTFRLVVTDDRGAVSAASTVTVTVNPSAPGNATLTGFVRFARVTYRGTPPFGLDYGNPVMQPARGVIVRALDATTQVQLATGVTGADGGYALSVPGDTSIAIQVVARMQPGGAQPSQWDVRVQDGVAATAPYSFTSAVFNSGAGARNIDIPTGIGVNGMATGQRASGAFAILDTIYRAIQTVLEVAPSTSFPELYVDWGSQTEGSFFTSANGQHIALTADLTEDADEFDQHTVAHEFGHYIERNFSRADNIGGTHGLGDRLDPRVAFGEGFGYAFAGMVLNDPIARDGFVSNGTQVSSTFNMEANPGPGQGCWCSESSVWSILWDIYDGASDANDNVSLGFAPIWEVLTSNAYRGTLAFTTVFPFIAALKVVRPAEAAAINTLVAAQNIDAAIINAFANAETHAPAANLLPLYTDIGVGTPVTVRSIDDFGHHNKLGNRRFLRFVPTTSGPVRVTLTTSNPDPNADPDFIVFRNDTLGVLLAWNPPPQPEIRDFFVTAGTTYIIDAYDCANGCDTEQGTPGDYDLTVTIN